LYVANWPKPRINAWETLLKARAIENMSYCIGVNRIGLDANNYEYSGHSAAYNCLGSRLSSLENDKEGIEVVSLDKNHISTIRNKLKFLDDKDEFTVT
jgi:predicted amidohydrolase